MNPHKHVRLSPRGRALLVDRIPVQGLRIEEAAHAAGVSVRTAYKWLKRYREEGPAGLVDRSSRPHACPHALSPAIGVQVLEQRRSRQTYCQIAQRLCNDQAPSPGDCAVPGCTAWPNWSRRCRRTAMNTTGPANCCIWTSRSWGGSVPRATV